MKFITQSSLLGCKMVIDADSWSEALFVSEAMGLRRVARLYTTEEILMHTESMKEDQGEFGQDKVSERECPRCGQALHYRVWESNCGGYEDIKYTCPNCNYTDWSEGPDA